MEIVAKTRAFVKEHDKELILFLGVVLASLISFAAGYLLAKEHLKTPVIIQEINGAE